MSTKSYIESRYAQFISRGLLTLRDAVESERLPAEMASARAVIIPSLFENYPYVCMQAMSMGMPIVASIDGGQAEMLGCDQDRGEVFDWSITGSFERAVELIGKLSADRLAELGGNGRHFISHECDPEHIAERRSQHLARLFKAEPEGKRGSWYPFSPMSYAESQPPDPKQSKSSNRRRIRGRLSVVVPFYNLADYLSETLASIKAARGVDLELIVVNDGSTEVASVELLDSISKTDPDVRIINIENQGLANARNVGAGVASGQYLAFVDADDLVDSEYFKRCIDLLEKYENVSFVYSWLEYFDGSEGLWINFDTEFPYLLAANMLAAFLVIRTDDFCDCAQNNSSMEYGMEDFEAWIRLVATGKRGVSIPEPLVKYRVRGDSMARQFNRSTILYLYEQMVKLNRHAYKSWGDELFMLVNANGPGYLWHNGSLNYPPVALGESSSSAPSITTTEFNVGDLLRIKRLATHPWIARIIRLILRLRLDERMPRR